MDFLITTRKSQRQYALKCYEYSFMLIIPQLITMNNHINKTNIVFIFINNIFCRKIYIKNKL